MQNTSSEVRPAHSTGRPRVALIAAVAANGVIGDDNRLPWRLAADLSHFRALTTGHAVIMGRKTWESLPRVLPGRQNIIVTRQRDYAAAGAEVAGSFDEARGLVRLPEPAFCIGGGELYRAALPCASTLYLTLLDRAFDGDARFPSLADGDWRETARTAHSSDGPDPFGYAFVTYERAAPAD
jgi:dihydrofolate reductase